MGRLGAAVLKDHHTADQISSLDMGNVVALHPQRQDGQAQFLLQFAHSLLQDIGVVEPFDPVLGQALNGVLDHHIKQLFTLAALGASELDGAAAAFLEPVANQLPVIRGVLEQNSGRDDQSGLVELADEVAHHQRGAFVLGAFHKEVVAAD